MFKVFRQTGDFVCFQEALHEIAFLAREDPEQLLSLSGRGEAQRDLRHPALDKPYFFELHSRHAYWKDHISPSAIFDAAFPESDQTSTTKYFDSLIRSSSEKPAVFQECRTPFRIEAMKALKGTHVYLSRNPLEQWWSQKTTPYFEIANRMFIDAPKVPPSVVLLRKRIKVKSSPHIDLVAKYQFHKSHQLTYEHQFEVFLLLWSLAEIQAHNHADIRVDMDAISESPAAKNQLIRQLEDKGIHGVDLSLCDIPTGLHSSDEIKMLTEKAGIVLEILRASGSSTADVAVVEKAIEVAVERSKLTQTKGDTSHSAKLKAMHKSQHENSLNLLEEAHSQLQTTQASARSREQEVQALQSEKGSILEIINAVEHDSQLKDKELDLLRTTKSALENDKKLKDEELDVLRIAKNALESDKQIKDKELNVLQAMKSALENDNQLKAEKIATILSEKHALFLEYEDRVNTIKRLTIKQEKQKKVSESLRKDIGQYKNQQAELILNFEELDAAHRGFLAASSNAQTHLKEKNSQLAKELVVKKRGLEKSLIAANERKIQLETLEEMLAHLKAVIDNRDDQMRAIKATTSWRITAPLRVVRGKLSLNDKIKSKGLVAIRRRPFFKSLVLMVLLPFPRIKESLEGYSRENETIDSLVEATDHLPIYTHEDHWSLIPTLPNAKKWQGHFKGSK